LPRSTCLLLLEYGIQIIQSLLRLWDHEDTITEYSFSYDRHPLFIRVEGYLLCALVLIQDLPNLCLINQPLHILHKKVNQPDLCFLPTYSVLSFTYKLVIAVAAVQNAFQQPPCRFVLHKSDSLIGWDYLVSAKK